MKADILTSSEKDSHGKLVQTPLPEPVDLKAVSFVAKSGTGKFRGYKQIVNQHRNKRRID